MWFFLFQSPEMPPFMLEPSEGGSRADADPEELARRLRNDSYIGAVSAELHVRAGLQVKSLNVVLSPPPIYLS